MKIETKSRYEVISDLEEQKRELIRERDGFDDVIKARERRIKDINRALEDKQEDLKDFKAKIKDNEKTLNALIKSVDESLQRLSKLNQTKKN